MGINIALNTVVYIVLFLFPGILFRKFYYRGEFSKQFHQGNLLERFLWTLFYSVLIVIISFFLVKILVKAFDITFFETLTYEGVKKIFEDLNKNTVPSQTNINSTYPSFFVLLSFLYLMAIFLGVVTHSFVTLFKIDVLYAPFRFRNHWSYIIRGNYGKYTPKNYVYEETIAEVLTIINNDEEVIYSGKIEDYYIDYSSNRLQSIFLSGVKKKKGNKYTEIKGDTFCIQQDHILNVNFRYVFIKGRLRKKYKNWENTLGLLVILTAIVVVFSVIFSKTVNNLFDTNYKRALFIFSTIVILRALFDIILTFIENGKIKITAKGLLPLIAPLPILIWSFDFLLHDFKHALLGLILIVLVLSFFITEELPHTPAPIEEEDKNS